VQIRASAHHHASPLALRLVLVLLVLLLVLLVRSPDRRGDAEH
jgi:hypothetical protein